MKFDVVVGNPPYAQNQGRTSGGAGGKTQWDKFLEINLRACRDGGHLAMIHPNGWRLNQRQSTAWAQITGQDLQHLEMFDAHDGESVFGASTNFDWYVLQRQPYGGNTRVVFQDGVRADIDIAQTAHLRLVNNHRAFAILSALTLKPCSNNLCSSQRLDGKHTDNPTDTHTLKAIGGFRAGQPRFIYGEPEHAPAVHLGKPKLVFSCIGSTDYYYDKRGEFGVSNADVMAFTGDNSLHFQRFERFLLSDAWATLSAAIRVSNQKLNRPLLRTLDLSASALQRAMTL